MTAFNFKDNYSYAEYLETWESRFGDDSAAQTTGYVYGKPHTYQIHRLTEAEFDQHIAEMDRLYELIDRAQADSDTYEYQATLFEQAFPHEIALLV